MNNKYNKYFEFPKGLLNQISECSPEGYLLFYIDQNGEPQVRADFIQRITEVGLRSHAVKILNSITDVEESEMRENILRASGDREEEDEDGEL